MRKLTWEVTILNKARCEVCKGAFGLTRHRFAQKQFCSKQCLEWYQAERMHRSPASNSRSISPEGTEEAVQSHPSVGTFSLFGSRPLANSSSNA